MKELYQEELKKLIASYFVMTRKTENISQNKMSEWLLISERSYVDVYKRQDRQGVEKQSAPTLLLNN